MGFARGWFGILAALAALIVVYALQSVWTHAPVRPDISDFRVVYCGERAVVREHADPYRVEPLRTCEHRIRLESGEPAWSVTPFPLPSYTVAALSPLGFLPYRSAQAAWVALLAAAFALAAAAIAKILGASAFAVGLVFAPTLGMLNLHYGEPVLVSVAALCLAALAVHERRPQLAAVAAAVSMIEPHVGLPAALGVFAFVPEARRTLALAAVVLGAAGLLTLGPATNLEYARGFLAAQARAELLADDQFSLSHLLYVLGAAPGAALRLGSLSYGCTLLLGLWAARLLARRGFTRGLFVLVPVATAMFGGPFIHDVQIAAALPAALVLAQRQWAARGAVALLALDWTMPLAYCLVPVLAAGAGTSAVVFGRATMLRRGAYALGTAAAVLVVVAGVSLAFDVPPPTRSGPTPPAPPRAGAPMAGPLPAARDAGTRLAERAGAAVPSNALSSLPWALRIRTTPDWSETGSSSLFVKIPVWAGLLLIPFSLLTLRARPVTAGAPLAHGTKVPG